MKHYSVGINWDEIEHRYITGTESYNSLSCVYNIPIRLIGRHAKENEWVKKRKEYRLAVKTKAQAVCEKSAVESLKELGAVASKAVSSMSEYFDAEGMTYEPNEFRQLTGALKDLTNVLRDIYDITESKAEDSNTVKIDVVLPEGMSDYGC